MGDITGGRAKIITTVLFELFWSIGLILLPGLAIFVNNWTHLYVAISMPTLVLVFLHRQVTNILILLISNLYLLLIKFILAD